MHYILFLFINEIIYRVFFLLHISSYFLCRKDKYVFTTFYVFLRGCIILCLLVINICIVFYVLVKKIYFSFYIYQ